MRMDVPMTRWLGSYDRAWLTRDLVAGATVWAVLVPSALAYAGIVGVDPIVGLYTVPPALILYAIFGSSRLMVVGADAAVSVLAAVTVAPLVADDNYLELVLALSLLVGLVYVAFWLLGMGWIADLVPDPVLKGFIQGLVWVTILDQIPKLLGIELVDAHDGFWLRAIDVLGERGDIHTETALLGLATLIGLFVLKSVAPRLPSPLIAVAVTILVVAIFGLDGDGVSVVGEPTGPAFDFGLPTDIGSDQLVDLLPGAVAIAVLGFTQSIGAAKSAAQTTGETVDPDQELLAIGLANIGSGISGGYPVSGALSKTSVAIASGGRTQVGNIAAATLGVITILVLRPVLEWLALAALAAIVVYAMSGMSDIAYFRRLWQISRREFGIGVLSFLVVLTFGVLPGVIIGVVLSLILLVEQIGDPPTAVLGRTPAGIWHDISQVEDAEQISGLIVWRQEAPLVFLNARRLANGLRDLAAENPEVVVLDASVTSGVDSTGLTAFYSAADELRAAGIDFWVVHPLTRTWTIVEVNARVSGRALPPVFASVDDAVAAFHRRTDTPQDRFSP
jgi:SulP family sulfate permease